MKQNVRTYIFLLLNALVATYLIYTAIMFINHRTIESCMDKTGLTRYEQFSKSSDPVKNEYLAKFRFRNCLKDNNIYYRQKITSIENKCKESAVKITGGKGNLLFPVTADDWYEFMGIEDYTGFIKYVDKETIGCVKANVSKLSLN